MVYVLIHIVYNINQKWNLENVVKTCGWIIKKKDLLSSFFVEIFLLILGAPTIRGY